ncbi:MAG: Tol-Pal system beta propeller repeat protein TolB, partial [Pseudomonadota bacterium]|nr:Tol-Pal system beta propeller repeat protein TolB [Pseudomonadota bacterium]
ADQIFEALMGYRGVFSTRIAYITDAEGTYELQVADADGQNPLGVLSAQEPIISPAWSPDGSELAYVSFENGRPGIYIQELATGRRERVVGFPGINGAPAWSPDGQRLAVTLSKDGDPEIYIYERATGGLHRITNHYAIDTEAAWAPDGRSLLFTSDRSGGPQIYQVPTSGGTPRRITFDAGNYNARASFSPDGGSVTFVTRSDRGYHIAVLELASGKHRVLTDGRLDESPSFAPNGKSIIYTTTQSGREMLATVSVDGRIRQQLAVEQVRVREPAWSPFLN